ncbi:phosphoadenylyl-sulfate reductase [Flavobacteriaceae bacterium]|nr:phosphoadenylyl-sulfate reductase [Flavobacteriaceae bacterium]
MENNSIEKLNQQFASLSLEKAFETLSTLGFKNIAFSTSLGQEDQVLTDVIFRNNHPIKVFTLDTGRLFEQTYDVLDKTQKKYNKSISSFAPDNNELEALLDSKGPYSFYDSIENRKECCSIRKINPLQKALKGVDLWITGLRTSQSNSRSTLSFFSYDDAFGLPKFNPLVNWTLEEVENYLEQNNVPQNSLHKKGFVSIGCEPCTRAVKPGEDIRSGRWWWEESKKECGLHLNHKS